MSDPDAPRPPALAGGRERNKVVGDAAGADASNSQHQVEGEHPRRVVEGRRSLLLQWIAARNEHPRNETPTARAWVLDVPRPATWDELVDLGVIDGADLAIPVGSGGAP